MSAIWVLEVLAIGLVSGYLSGQLGIGGGLITTPAIKMLFGRPDLVAVATPLLVMIPSSATGGLNFARRGYVRWDLIPGLAGGGLAGAASGAYVTRFVSGRWILIVTAVIMLGVAVQFLIPGRDGREGVPADPAETRGRAKAVAAGRFPAYVVWGVGLGVGLYSGFLGLGGGVLMVPALAGIFRTRMKEALGTSLVVITAYAAIATIMHALLGHVDFLLGVVMAAGTVPGAYLGSRVAVSMRESSLRLVFGLFLAVLAVGFAYFEMVS